MSEQKKTIADIVAWLRRSRDGEKNYITLERDEIADRIESAHNREIAAKDDERLTIVANYNNVIKDLVRNISAKDAEIAKLKDCILKEIDWLKRMIKGDLEGWATSMWSPSDEFRKHTFSRLIEDNTYHIERMKKALEGGKDEVHQ